MSCNALGPGPLNFVFLGGRNTVTSEARGFITPVSRLRVMPIFSRKIIFNVKLLFTKKLMKQISDEARGSVDLFNIAILSPVLSNVIIIVEFQAVM